MDDAADEEFKPQVFTRGGWLPGSAAVAGGSIIAGDALSGRRPGHRPEHDHEDFSAP
jgi:hypothetical protein